MNLSKMCITYFAIGLFIVLSNLTHPQMKLLTDPMIYSEANFYSYNGKIYSDGIIVKFKEKVVKNTYGERNITLDYFNQSYSNILNLIQLLDNKYEITAIEKQIPNAEWGDTLKYHKITGELISVPDMSQIVTLRFRTPIQIDSLIEMIALYSEVEYVHEPVSILFQYTPNDEFFGSQWYLEKIDAELAWDISKGDGSTKIAIIDVGIKNHSDLIIAGGNGYQGPKAHGTNVAGVACAIPDNIIGIAGLGWNTSLYNYGASSLINANTVANLIYDAWDRDTVDVINMSFLTVHYVDSEEFSVYCPDCEGDNLTNWINLCENDAVVISKDYLVVKDAIQTVTNLGAICVAAAGNRSKNKDNIDPRDYLDPENCDPMYVPYDIWPAMYNNVISSSGTFGTGNEDFIPNYNYGSYVDFSAPGYGLLTTGDDNNYTSVSGTSFSSPLCGALICLMKSLNPGLGYNDIYDILKETSDEIGKASYINGRNDYLGYGRINAYKALKYTLENYGGTLTQDLTIPVGETWNFNVPGVTVTLENGASIIVNGTLNVQGLSNNPIIFDRSGSNNWYGIVINSSSGSSSNITNAVIKNANYGLVINNASPSISSTKINYCNTGILIMSGAAPKFYNNTITYNNYNGVQCIAGVTASFGTFPTWGDNVIRRNGNLGIYAAYSCTVFLGQYTLPPTGGRNSIYENYNTNGYQISIRYGSTSMAEMNWWGSDPPDPSIFNTSSPNDIDYDPWWTGSDPHAGRSLSKSLDNGYNPDTPPVISRLDSLREKLWKAFIFYQKAEYDSVLQIGKGILTTSPSSQEALSVLNVLRLAYNESGKSGFQNYIKSLIAQHSGKELAGVARLNLAYYLAKQRDFVAALDLLKKNINDFPNSPLERISLFQKAVFFLLELEDRESTEAVLAELERKYPDDPLVVETQRLLGRSIQQYRPQKQAEPSDNIDFALLANYPNPFNPTTTIEYSIPEASFVELKVYDILGGEVASLVKENKTSGKHSVKFNASNLPSGIYFYRIVSGNFSATKKLIILK